MPCWFRTCCITEAQKRRCANKILKQQKKRCEEKLKIKNREREEQLKNLKSAAQEYGYNSTKLPPTHQTTSVILTCAKSLSASKISADKLIRPCPQSRSIQTRTSLSKVQRPSKCCSESAPKTNHSHAPQTTCKAQRILNKQKLKQKKKNRKARKRFFKKCKSKIRGLFPSVCTCACCILCLALVGLLPIIALAGYGVMVFVHPYNL